MTDEEMAEEYTQNIHFVFEKEAEEYKDTYFGFADERISEVQDFEGNYIDISERIMKTFIDGAEFGYNKAQEASKNKAELDKAKELLRECRKYHFHPEVTEYPYNDVEAFLKE